MPDSSDFPPSFLDIHLAKTLDCRHPRVDFILCDYLDCRSGVLIRFEQRQAERDAAIREATGNAVVSSIETLNTLLASFRTKYGEYPARLEQLNFPSGGPVNSDRAGLAKFPMPVEQFFVFSYTARRTSGGKYFGYEFYADPKPGKWSELDHYYSDENGLIHFDVSHDSCKRGLIVSQQLHPSVTVE